MAVEEEPTDDAEPIGWAVTDPDGNIIASGPVTEAMMAALAGDDENDKEN